MNQPTQVSNESDSSIFNRLQHFIIQKLPEDLNEARRLYQKGSLYELAKSQHFDMHLSIAYMERFGNSISIFEFLVNEMYLRFINTSYFYLPQLCSLLIFNPDLEGLEQFLIEQCTDKMKFAVKIYWLILSFKSSNHILEDKARKIEMAMVNNKRKKSNKRSKEMTNENYEEIYKRSLSKEIRLNYFIKLCGFYEQLISICNNLMKVDRNLRKIELDKQIENLNASISRMKKKINPELKNDINSYFYYGILLPFDDSLNTFDEETNLIVRILPDYSSCYNSKARVPVKFTFETIKAKELKYWDELVEQEEEANAFLNTECLSFRKNSEKIIEYNSIDDFLLLHSFRGSKDEINKKEELDAIEDVVEDINYFSLNTDPNKNSQQIKQKFENMSAATENGSERAEAINIKENNLIEYESLPYDKNPFGKPWSMQVEEIKEKSRFRKFSTYGVSSFIFKSNDDLKQELMCIQLIKRCQEIFAESSLDLKLNTYEIMITSENSGIIEVLPNTCSVDQIKKWFNQNFTLKQIFLKVFGSSFEEAQMNFIQSLAAYSLICYLFQIKDRHNGNILINNHGHIIHIDFGFIMGISPGKFNFESVPFKLTQDYIELMGGIDSELYRYFIIQIAKGFMALRKHIDNLVSIINIMKKGCKMPCFETDQFEEKIAEFRNRLINPYGGDYISYAEYLVGESADSWRTNKYDSFQKFSNNIYA